MIAIRTHLNSVAVGSIQLYTARAKTDPDFNYSNDSTPMVDLEFDLADSPVNSSQVLSAIYEMMNVQLPSSIHALEKSIPVSHPAISLMKGWLNSSSDYDEKTWPVVKQMINEDSLSDRKKFNE